MSNKRSILESNKDAAPQTLEGLPFYGIELDNEQKAFRDAIWSKDKLIIFCDSKSGAGKTTIATGVANMLVKHGRYENIVYVASPTQEEKQGYLKGTLEEKSEPYFEPFYQALKKLGLNLNTILSSDIINQKNGTSYISCATHTFLRGTNFENSVVIIDECQNFSVSELQKVLTRIHDNCKVVLIGHSGQIDLVDSNKSGFAKYKRHFAGYDKTGICRLTKNYRGWISSTSDEIK